MTLSSPRLLQRRCRSAEIGVHDTGNGRAWPTGEVLLASVARPDTTHWLLTIPQAALAGEALTDFLERVAPFGCPVPGSLIRAYSLPDAAFPSVLLREHEAAPAGMAHAYLRLLHGAGREWIAALAETGAGLCPVQAVEGSGTPRGLTARAR